MRWRPCWAEELWRRCAPHVVRHVTIERDDRLWAGAYTRAFFSST